MRYPGQFAHLKRLINKYSFEKRSSDYLKLFFSKNKKFGSKDRRFYKEAFFSYLRLSAFLNPSVSLKEKLVLSMAFKAIAPKGKLLEELIDEEFILSQEELSLSGGVLLDLLEEKGLVWTEKLFPAVSEISNKLDVKRFLRNQFNSPGIHLRVRKQEEKIKTELAESGINILLEKDGHLICKSNARFYDLKAYKFGSIEIQDINSTDSLKGIMVQTGELWWDACAGAGGKSILFKDLYPKTKLFSSDMRASSLAELTRRAKRNQIQIESVEQIDTENPEFPLEWPSQFDGIIIDAPCTGSGTWIRNPELLNRPVALTEIEEYSETQKRMLASCSSKLKENGQLIYITCSVYAKENEGLLKSFAEEHNFEIVKMDYKWNKKIASSTLFVAHLKKL